MALSSYSGIFFLFKYHIVAIAYFQMITSLGMQQSHRNSYKLPDMQHNANRRLNSVPILYTSGTHYEVGFDVGRTFRGIIEDFLLGYNFLHDTLIPAYETPEGKHAYDVTLESLNENFPHYVRELQGTADGAKVPFIHLMLLHMDMIIPKNSGQSCPGSSACTSICCNYEQQVILGHTEDALPEVMNYLYIVSAHIKEDTPQGRWKTKQEEFTSLCYAGHLPGLCMSYNYHGLVFSMNMIFSTDVVAGKTPRHFLTRALLSADTNIQAEHILRDKGVGSADGFSVNMSFIRQEGDHLFHNAEIGPTVDSNESPMSVLTLSPGEFLVHTNRFLRLQITEDLEIEGESSEHRMARAAQRYPIDSRDAVVSILSDIDDKDFPIFREGKGKDPIKTVAVGVFDILERNWTIWMKNPALSEPLVTLPMTFKWNS